MSHHDATVDRSRPGLLIGLVLFGTVLRLYAIQDSLWVDELHTAWTVAGEWRQIATRASLGNNGPLYFWFVRLVTDVLGCTEWTVRCWSVLAGVGLMVATYWVAKQWRCHEAAALCAAGLVAIDGNALFFAGEARSYALVQCVAILHLYWFWCCLTNRGEAFEFDRTPPSVQAVRPRFVNWILWVLSGVVLFHLHFTTGLIFVAEAVAYVLLLILKQPLPARPARVLCGGVAMALGTLPALGLLQQIASRRDNWALFISKASFLDALQTYPLENYALYPVVCGAVAVLVQRWRGGTSTQRVSWDGSADVFARGFQTAIVICGTVLFVPLFVAWVATEWDWARLLFVRYLIASSVSLSLLAALLLTRFVRSPSVVRYAAVAVFGIAVFTISPLRFQPQYWPQKLAHNLGEDWRSAVDVINAASPDIPVILYSGLIETDDWHASPDELKAAYCQLPLRGIYAIAARQKIVSLPMTSKPVMDVAALPELRVHGAWLVIRGRAKTVQRVREAVSTLLGSEFRMDDDVRDYGKVTLVRVLSES